MTMQRWRSIGAVVLAVSGGVAGCETSGPPGDPVGREDANQCGGWVFRQQANLANGAAEQLGRWEALKDFQLSADGARIELSAVGSARCRNGCSLISGVLALQAPDPTNTGSGDDPPGLAAALVRGWRRQQ